MSEAAMLHALADAFDAASTALRQRAALSDRDPGPGTTTVAAVDRARALHPQLGPRQATVIDLLERHGREGTSTAVLSKFMDHGHPKVYLTLRNLVLLGLVEKDESVSPHNYRLAGPLCDGA